MKTFSNLVFQADGKRPVSLTEAWDFAKKIDAKYIETSSFTKVSL